MKIAHIAPINFNIPSGRGGPEQAAYNLQEGLVADGADVTLFGCKNFRAAGKLQYLYAKELNNLAAYRKANRMMRAQMMVMHYAYGFEQAADFDVIQTHIPDWTLPFLSMHPKTPVVIKCSNRLNPFIKEMMVKFHPKNLHYVSISETQKKTFPKQIKNITVIHESVDTEHIRPQYKKQDYFLFIGRLIEWKQPHIAIEAAIAAKKKLYIIGTAPQEEDKENFAYFKKFVLPRLSHPNIKYVRHANRRDVFNYYRNAKGVIFPTKSEEPFGLVFIEALAAGTPLIGSNNTHAREIVGDKKVSLLANSVEEMAHMLDRVEEIDPRDCRAYAEQHYSRKKIAAEYLALYRKLLKRS